MKPKRKRAYHRALKRGEPWALMEKGTREITRQLAIDFYADALRNYILTPNPFLNMIRKEEK